MPDHREDFLVFARALADVATELGIVTDPQLDEARGRLIDRNGVVIDAYNPWHLTSCNPSAPREALAEYLQPTTLGSAGYLGRVDVIRRLLAAGADPGAADSDGITPIDRTICAWVTTDLHVACIETLLDAGALACESHADSLRIEAIGNPAGIAMAELLSQRATDSELRRDFAHIAEVFRANPVP